MQLQTSLCSSVIILLTLYAPLAFENELKRNKEYYLANSLPQVQEIPYSTLIGCEDDPSLADDLLNIGLKLGVKVYSGQPKISGKDATYQAHNGRIGTIILSPREMPPEVYCQLISHEFIHVLQHINSNLTGVNPLGWKVTLDAVKRFGSLQEAEAYTYQDKAGLVLNLLLNEVKTSN